jgi:transcription antitermination protein NusB
MDQTMNQEKTSIHGRTAARMAAIQALYQLELEPENHPSQVIQQFVSHHFQQQDELVQFIKPDLQWFDTLVRGVMNNRDSLDSLIRSTLSEDWRLERLEVILRTILRLGAYELTTALEIPIPIVINEYVSLTKAFFDQKEPSFVNASLDKIAKTIQRT